MGSNRTEARPTAPSCPASADQDVIYIVDRTMEKLRAEYAHVRVQDDEYVVPAYTIAETSIFVDCARLDDSQQERSRFNVLARGRGVDAQLQEMSAKYAGKVRLSLTHVHQFGDYPTLSSIDINGYRRVLADTEASKPYADGNRMPVILVTSSGLGRRFLGFIVTPADVIPARLEVISGSAPIVSSAWARARVAMPNFPRGDIIDNAARNLGPEWDVRLIRSARTGAMAILLSHANGEKYLVELTNEYPLGRPTIRGKGNRVVDARIDRAFDHSGLLEKVRRSSVGESGFSLHVAPGQLPHLVNQRGASLNNQIIFMDHINWRKLGHLLLMSNAETRKHFVSSIVGGEERVIRTGKTGRRDSGSSRWLCRPWNLR